MAVAYPYIPDGREIRYVPESNEYMQAARAFALEHSLDTNQQTGSVVVLDAKIVGYGANGSDYHKEHGCERVRRSIPTGKGYELCEGCHPKNHSEPRAIAHALKDSNELRDADLYLWGHWWCCEPCWNSIIEAGIANVYLVAGSEVYFNREHPDNRLKQNDRS